jgi:aspartate racemase
MNKHYTGGTLGVVGGLGPLASSEFVKTIYEYGLGGVEQESPVVFLHSDPTCPDRTGELLAGNGDAVLEQLVVALRRMRDIGASRVVICCVTIHHLLPSLSEELKRPIISLVDVILSSVVKSRRRHLLMCTTGARKLNIFQTHPQWGAAEDYVILPDESDQRLIHDEIIYRIKRNFDLRELTPLVEQLLSKYGTNSFIAGCTELHLLAKYLKASKGHPFAYEFIDPLDIIAREVTTGHQ